MEFILLILIVFAYFIGLKVGKNKAFINGIQYSNDWFEKNGKG